MPDTLTDQVPEQVRYLDLWSLCVWAYRDQRVGRALAGTMAVFEWMIGEAEPEYIGTTTPRLHADAVAVHGAVVELGELAAQRIIEAAQTGTRPEPSAMTPVAYPMEPRYGGESGWFLRDGRRVPYRIIVKERVTISEPVYRRRGRHRMAHADEQLVTYPVEYCPLDWSPDPAYLDFSNDLYRQWVTAMAALATMLEGVQLRRHRLTGFAHQPAPTWDEPIFTDAAAAQLERDRQALAVALDGSVDGSTASMLVRDEAGDPVGVSLHGIAARARHVRSAA